MKFGPDIKIQDIKIGDYTSGGEVTAVMVFGPDDQAYDYKGVTVSATHPVFENNKWKRVEDSDEAILLRERVDVWYDFNTTSHTIYVNNIKFSDFAEIDFNDELEKTLWDLTLQRKNSLEHGSLVIE